MSNKVDEFRNDGYYIGVVDGLNSRTYKTFLVEIAVAFQFPDYYGGNTAAFDECINDLDWIVEQNYCLVITNSHLFMSDDPDNKEWLLSIFYRITTEWANVPNFEGEEEFRHKADFKVVFE